MANDVGLRVIAQGSLLTCKMDSEIKRQQKKSCIEDWRKYHKALHEAKNIVWEWERLGINPREIGYKKIDDTTRKKLVALKTNEILTERNVKVRPRGAITEFSRASRLRLLKASARLADDVRGLFVTFTYRENMQDAALAKEHLHKLMLWIAYHYEKAACIWRMEFQGRGAIHFHVMILNITFIPAKEITEYWQRLTGDDSYPDIERMGSKRKISRYMSKYIAKREQAVSSTGLDNLSYLKNAVGRFWGVCMRKNMPYAEMREISVTGSMLVYAEMKRYARRKYKRISKRIQGFALFVDNPYRWLDLLLYTVMNC